ncbi:hypothetical protein BDDG_08313 [Blastomyces dermatitidis ATCC 18188]|uniref:Uncharacterized protein n=1 Tax=Ajellomyces dermatitidis (strain ATCC 18188 / CBS 674.68) TaxID=653446 RepID=F2TQ55_AJEDA|nr:hypothetical protein BDDG_08313 [Blastomyces dermatitidis ATCC 18188]
MPKLVCHWTAHTDNGSKHIETTKKGLRNRANRDIIGPRPARSFVSLRPGMPKHLSTMHARKSRQKAGEASSFLVPFFFVSHGASQTLGSKTRLFAETNRSRETPKGAVLQERTVAGVIARNVRS